MRRRAVLVLILLAGCVADLAPAIPALSRYAAIPKRTARPTTLLLAGVAPKYAPTPPWPVLPEDFTGASDTLVLAQVRSDGTTHLLSIPRDTWTTLPGQGWHKINAANALGGPELLVQAVQQLTGIHVDGYVLISLNAMRAMTDAAGGVSLDVPRRMKYDDQAGHLHIDLQPGRQHLGGQQAEGFLRFRHDGLGDIGRVQRQQLFMTAFVNRLKSPFQWWRVPAVVGALDENMKSNLTRLQVAHLLGGAMNGVTVTTHLLPGRFGASTWLPDHAAISTLVKETFRDPSDPRGLHVTVVNVGAPGGSARRLKEKLEGLGYQFVETANGVRQDVPTTVTGPAASAVVRDMGFGQVMTTEGSPGAGITVFLGSDTPSE